MLRVATCLSSQHDLRLVALAGLVCLLASLTAFRLLSRARDGTNQAGWPFLALASVVAGAGVWATHFIAMQAYQPGLRTGYAAGGTAASLALAVAGMALGFTAATRLRSRSATLAAAVGGAALGLGVGAMHYTGMAAFRTEGLITWEPALVASSLVLGMLLSGSAVAMAGGEGGFRRQGAAALVLTIGICALHFTGMGAVEIFPDGAVEVPAQVLATGPMVALVAGLTAFIVLAALGTALLDASREKTALRQMRLALDAMPQALAFFDRDDRVVMWNQHYEALNFECAHELAPGAPFRRLLEAGLARGHYAEARGREEAWLAERLAARAAAPCTLEQTTADGRWLRIEDRRAPDGGVVSVCVDVTDLKHQAQALAEARDAAEAASRAKDVFLANMSHEIRTPLNGIIGMAELLSRSDLGPRELEMIRTVRASGATLDRLLSDILDLSRAEARRIDIVPEPFDLAECVSEACALWGADAALKGLPLDVHVAPAAQTWVLGDRVRLGQVLGNLVSNAVKFTESGRVSVQADRAGDRVRLRVRDTGIGFDPDLGERLFSRFQQADGSITRRYGGSGLGLAICRELVELMGGTIACDGRPGAGAVFEVTLPLPVVAAAEDEALQSAADPARRMSVLLVDDHPVNRRVVQMMLAGTDVEVVEVEDGLQAVEAVAERRFDLVLMDMQMPVMDGLSATRAIRELERQRGEAPAPIFMLTANAGPEHVEAGRLAGAQRHLTKPITPDTLFEALEAAAAGGGEPLAA